MKKNSYLIVAVYLVILTLNVNAEGSQKIVKWKDDQGITHYGDVLPSQEAGRANAFLNKEGVVVKKNQSFSQNDQASKASEADYAAQLRKDSALLASYSSIEEIDLARARNTQNEEGNLKSLRHLASMSKRYLSDKQAIYDGMIKNKKSPPAYLVGEIKAYQQKLAKLESDIISTENNIASIQTRFAGYKLRYAELRPRNQTLSSINVSKKTLAELDAWKREANLRLNYYLNETVKFKRAGSPIPDDVSNGVEQANREIARAEAEMSTIEASIKNSQQTFSSK